MSRRPIMIAIPYAIHKRLLFRLYVILAIIKEKDCLSDKLSHNHVVLCVLKNKLKASPFTGIVVT
ncbi:hypothetical protein D3H65_22605 [Paraflavitalea soli]|uniref:Uncharacterized protein n=1 Tax=Paraflavitalea soli TaxID=2315862 RepID=A0A3B7MTM8_9BACT|nr:hypothetical protein D3H65_22605 [Paraflavitalea soli]